MAFITYKQADSRWGSKNYNGSSSMATAGCGPTSCAMIIYGVDGKTTPLDTMKFMQSNGYAIRNNGTAWNGIPACLKHFGVKDVQAVNVDTSMAKVWELMKQGYVAVFLFRAGSRGGVTWTTSGHYVAVTDYKYENGKHYLYTRDSGGRNHTGWYCYETQMRGLIPKVWCGYVAKIEGHPTTYRPTKPYNGTVPTKNAQYGTTDNVPVMTFLNWCLGINLGKDGVFGVKSRQAIYDYQATYNLVQDGIFGPQCIAKAKEIINAHKKGVHKMGHCASRALDCVEANFTYSSSTSSAYHWTYVAVWKDEAKAEKCAEFAEQCNKRTPRIQYDDKPNLKSKVISCGGNMPSGSLTGNCSNYVNACVYHASKVNVLDYGAKNNRKYLEASGLFDIYEGDKVKGYVQRGAIYGGSHHTVISLGLK